MKDAPVTLQNVKQSFLDIAGAIKQLNLTTSVVLKSDLFNKAFGSKNQINKLSDSITRLRNAPVTLENVKKSLIDVAGAINQLNVTTNARNAQKGLTDYIKGIAQLAATKSLDKIETKLSPIFGTRNQFNSLVDSVIRLKNAPITLDNVKTSVLGVAGAVRQLNITSNLIAAPKGLFDYIKGIAQLGATKFAGFVSHKITDFIKGIGEAASIKIGRGGKGISSTNIGSITDFLKVYKDITSGLASISGNIPNLGSVTKLTTSFSQVVGAMKRLIELSDILPNDVFSRLKRKLGIGDISGPLRTIEFISKQLANMAGNIPNLQALNKLGNALENLGVGITKIVNLADIIPFDLKSRISRFFGLDKLSLTIGAISSITKKLADAAAGIGNIGDFSKFGNALEGIGKFVSAVNRTNLGDIKGSKLSRLPLIGKIFTQSKFKQIIGVIKDIAKAFAGFKGVAVPDFSILLPALVNFSQQASGIDFKKTNLSGFTDFTKQLAKGLKELSNTKIDTAKLAAIGASLSGLAGFKGIGGGGLQNAQVTQATSATRSIIENAAGQFIGQVAFSVLSRLQTFIGKLLNFSSSIRGALQSVGQSLNAFGLNAERVGKSLIQNFGLGQLANSPLVGIAADFDHLSNELQVFGNLTDEQLKHAQAFADEIGKKYPASSNEALQAILDLTQAGQDLNSIEFILPGAADLAILGSIDIPQATGALITATSVFDKFTDSVAATSDNVGVATTQFSNFDVVSRATIPGLIEGLTNVAPAAQLFKLNLQETLAGLAEFNDVGILGAEAGTQLAQVLNALTKPQAKEAFASLNDELAKIGSNIRVSIADAHGNLLPFDTIIKNLGGAFKELGLSEVQVLDVLSQIAGSRAKLGFATLIRDNGIQAMIDKTAELGTAAERAQVILNDFKGDVDQLKGSVETLNKNALLPLLQKSLRPFVKVARQIVDGLLGLPQSFFDLASNIIFVASSLATLVGSALIAIGVLAKFEGLLFRLGGSLIGLVTHLPALITGVVGFVAALGTIIVVATAVAAVIGGAALVLGGFRDVIERDIGHAGGAFRQFQAAITFMADRVGIVLNAVGRVITLIFGGTAQQEVQDFGTRVADFFNRLTIGSLSLFDTLEQVTAFFENFGNFVEVGFGHSSATQIAFFEDQLRKLSTFPLIRAIFGRNATPTGLRNVFRDVFAFFTKLKTAVENVFSGAVGVLFGEPGAIQRVHAGVAGLLSVISGLLKNATGLDLSSAILNFDQGKIGAGVTAFFVTVLGKVRDWFVQNRDAIINAVGDVLSFATGATFGAASFILRVLGLDAAADTVQRIGDTLSDLIHRAVNLAIRLFAGQPLIDASGVQKVIDTIIGDPIAFLNSVAETVSALITSALEQVPALLGDIGQRLNIAPLIDLGVTLENSAAFDQVATALGNIAGYPFDAAGKMFDGISALFESGNFTNGLAISGVLVALNALTNTGGLIALFSSLRAILFGAVLPVVGLVTLVSALGNLRELLQTGDAGAFLVNTLTDVASAVLSFFGVEMSGESIIATLRTEFDLFRQALPGILRDISGSLDTFIGNFIVTLESLRARIDVALGGIGASSGFGAAFFEASDALSKSLNETIFNVLNQPALDDATVHALAVSNSDKIIAEFVQVMADNPNVEDIPKVLFENIGQVLQRSDLLDRALAALPTDDVRTAFMDRLTNGLSTTGSAVSPEAGRKISESLTGGISQALADNLSFVDVRDIEQVQGAFSRLLDQYNLQDLTIPEQLVLIDQISLEATNPVVQKSLEDLRQRIKLAAITLNILPFDATYKANVRVEANRVDITPLSFSIRKALNGIVVPGFGTTLNGRGNINPNNIQATLPPGRAQGGALKPYSAYGVHDTASPEWARFNDGTSLLLTGRSAGSIVKIAGMAAAPPLSTATGAIIGQTSGNFGEDAASLDAAFSADKKARAARMKDTTKQIDKLLEQIAKSQQNFIDDENELQRKYRVDQLKAEEAFNHERGNTIADGHENLLDAIRRGDGAAALASVKATKKALDEQRYQFGISQAERLAQLVEQQRQNQKQRDDQLADYNNQLADLRASNDELAGEQATADQQAYDDQVAANRSLAEQQAQADADQKAAAAAAITATDDFFNRSRTGVVGIANALNGIIQNVSSTANLVWDQLLRVALRQAAIVANATNQIGTGQGPQQGGGTGAGSRGGGSVGTGGGGNTPGGTGGIGGAVTVPGRSTPLPAHPTVGQVFTDAVGDHWFWDGTRWNRVPSRARGGAILPRSVYHVFDSNRAEIYRQNDGSGLLLSGRQGGQMTPLPAGVPTTINDDLVRALRSPDYQRGMQNGPAQGAGTYGPVILQTKIELNFGDINSNATDAFAVATLARDMVLPAVNDALRQANSGSSHSMLELKKR